MWKETFYLFPADYQKLINFALNFCSSDSNDLKPRTNQISEVRGLREVKLTFNGF